MKKIVVFTVLIISICSVSMAQKVFLLGINVEKAYPFIEGNHQSLKFDLGILTDISTFTYKMDPESSVYTEIKDSNGFDLLAQHESQEADFKAKGYMLNPLKIEYISPIQGDDGKGIKVVSTIKVAPSAGAEYVHVKGTAGLICTTDKTSTFNLTDVPTKYQWGDPGYETDMGLVSLQETGGFSAGDVDYRKYRLIAMRPVTSIVIEGGDDREEASKEFEIGLYPDEMIFKSLPEKLNLTVVASDTEVVKIPIDIQVRVGF